MTTTRQLDEIARNLWWSWNPDATDLFRRLNPDAYLASGNNPLVSLKYARQEVMDDPGFQTDVADVHERFRAYMDAPAGIKDAPRTSYFCMEYGLHESMKLYAGGLGILAGDHTKAASDLGLPFTAVGLLLRSGYFRQYFDKDGTQQDEYPSMDATLHPFERVTNEDGSDLTVTVHIEDQPLLIRGWKVMVGKTTLYLLDTDFMANSYEFRFLTRRLYNGDRRTRIRQEIILGIGGSRFLDAVGVETDVYHMNEGHCSFLGLELLRKRRASGENRMDPADWVRSRCVFTTHTPVWAGHDRFDGSLLLHSLQTFQQELGMSDHELMSWGRVNTDDHSEQFTMTVLGLKLSRSANGVSRLNGEVARRQWAHMFPGREIDQVPIKHVTNGIHIPTWAAPAARPFLDEHFGAWETGRDRQDTWDRVAGISDEELWAYRHTLRGCLIEFVEKAVPRQTLPQDVDLDPDALTIGFARRFATYKRAPLIFHDPERAARIFSNSDRPVQLIYAGKAHPSDELGKEFIRQIVEFSRRPEFNGRVIFLEDYNIEIGRKLVSGCDVWLNNPRRPHEASGTSGQKVAVHGGLNLSIPDGWWPEGYDGTNGWSIGADSSHVYKDPAVQDPEDALLLYGLLENDVIPEFYERDEAGRPAAWIERMRRAMKTLVYPFSAHRMVTDYAREIYAAPSEQTAEVSDS